MPDIHTHQEISLTLVNIEVRTNSISDIFKIQMYQTYLPLCVVRSAITIKMTTYFFNHTGSRFLQYG